MDIEILQKALKLKTASIRGDEQIRDLAQQKYFDYLINHNLSEQDVLNFENKTAQKKPFFVYEGREFYTLTDFQDWYSTLSTNEKIKLAKAL